MLNPGCPIFPLDAIGAITGTNPSLIILLTISGFTFSIIPVYPKFSKSFARASRKFASLPEIPIDLPP